MGWYLNNFSITNGILEYLESTIGWWFINWQQKYKGNTFLGVNAADDVKLGLLELKPNYKLMMVGSLEADIKVTFLIYDF